MRTEEPVQSWVVYQTPTRHKPSRNMPGVLTAVCGQSEWEEMELAQPGYRTLIKAGILNEGEAERLARYGETGQPTPAPRYRMPRN